MVIGECMRKKISVIMLTYNREHLVSGAIESILAQSFIDFEFIIVDNGSQDRSGEIAEKYAKKDARITVIHIPKSSIGIGRNIGLDHASGEYITFMDDDDLAAPEMLEFLYDEAERHQADISICGTNLKTNEEKFVFNAEEAMLSLLERKYFNVGFPAKLIKHTLFVNNRFPDEGRFDDIYLMPQIIADAEKTVYWGKPYYIVNRHDNNNSAWTTNHSLLTREILNEYLEVYEKRTRWLIEKFPDRELDWKYYNWSFMISMVEKINRFDLRDCEDVLQKITEELQRNADVFLCSERILEFEKDWMEMYV